MAFHQVDPSYFPGPELWGSNEVEEAPKDLPTSGITQPPVFGFILSMMAKSFSADEEFIALVKGLYPKIKAFHTYLYHHRDPLKEDLAYINHNWESGTDNSPLWDEVLEGMDVSKARDVSTLRRDVKAVDASQRPTNENYKRYIYLVDLFREAGYDDEKIFAQTPFAIQDVLFNSMLIRSNEGLIELAQLIGEDANDIKAWNEKSIASLNKKCWNEDDGFYYDYDLKSNKQIALKVSNGFMPLFAGAASQQQAHKIASLFYGPILMMFVIRFYLKKIPAISANVGVVSGVVTNLLLWIFYKKEVFWFWWNVTGAAVTLLVALLLTYGFGFRYTITEDDTSPALVNVFTTQSAILLAFFALIFVFCLLLPKLL